MTRASHPKKHDPIAIETNGRPVVGDDVIAMVARLLITRVERRKSQSTGVRR